MPIKIISCRFVVSPASEEEDLAKEFRKSSTTHEVETPPKVNTPTQKASPPSRLGDSLFAPMISQSRSSTQICGDKSPVLEPPETPSPGRGHTSSSESEQERSDKSSPRSPITKSREWLTDKRRDPFPPLSSQILNHHLTIGPHGGIDWAKRFKQATANGGQSGANSESSDDGGTNSIRHSTDCIVAKELASSSDSDLLRSAPPWLQPRSKFRFSPDKGAGPGGGEAAAQEVRRPSAPASTLEKITSGVEMTHRVPRASLDPVRASLEPTARTSLEPTRSPVDQGKAPPSPKVPVVSEASASTSASPTAAEELAAKKNRVKSSLLKRARSVAIFSLKLKERRAKDAITKEAKALSPPKPVVASQQWTGRNPDRVEGELSCIPIEKLISVDDVANELMRKRTNT
jgi:anoctamin-8